MATEWFYQNAPLFEVIAEVRWKVVPVSSVPGGGVDPYFEDCHTALRELMKEKGFGFLETLAPPEVPIEFFSGQPYYRYRPNSEGWPLFQLGPGLFTANITPPYRGWTSFVPTLLAGFTMLLEVYPQARSLMKLSKLHLRYMDAFVSKHGRNTSDQFLKEGLGVDVCLPTSFGDQFGGAPDEISLELAKAIDSPKNGKLVFKALPGVHNRERATIAEFSVTSTMQDLKPTEDLLLEWFNEAHSTLHNAFKMFSTEDLVERMKPIVEYEV